MRLRVLGCHGGESPTHRATAFLIDETLLLDAGSATRSLSVGEQTRIDSVILSHAHLDHVRDLALLADNVIGVRKKPIEVYCTAPTAETLEKHVFNNLLWPDFTRIPNPAAPDTPIVRIQRVESGVTFRVGDHQVRLVPVNHPVDCQAIFLSRKGSKTLVYSGDTGPTELLWREINALDDLGAFIFEVSFPNHMQSLASVSGHLTPKTMAAELKKLAVHGDPRILLYHMKPGFQDVLRAQVAELGDPRLAMLKPMDELEI